MGAVTAREVPVFVLGNRGGDGFPVVQNSYCRPRAGVQNREAG